MCLLLSRKFIKRKDASSNKSFIISIRNHWISGCQYPIYSKLNLMPLKKVWISYILLCNHKSLDPTTTISISKSLLQFNGFLWKKHCDSFASMDFLSLFSDELWSFFCNLLFIFICI